jgi:hypothetical protein
MKLRSVYLAIALSLVFTQTSYAYLDPGTGSYVIQVTLGLLAGAFYMLKVYWQRLVFFFSKKQNLQQPENSGSSNESQAAQSSVDRTDAKTKPSNE